MQKKNKGALNLAGLVLFLLALPFFFGMGGGAFAMAEVLPGQAAASFLPYTEKTESLSAKVFGTKDVEFSQTPAVTKGGRTLSVSAEEMARLRDFSYLRSSYYIIDSRTALLPSDIDAEEALGLDFSIKKTTKEPKILIFHTHAHEGFADSDMSKGLSEGIWGAGEELKRILEEEYGIGVLHDDGQYDVVNGKGQITGAYERMEPPIRKILAEHPSIEVCIDLHRDGVGGQHTACDEHKRQALRAGDVFQWALPPE